MLLPDIQDPHGSNGEEFAADEPQPEHIRSDQNLSTRDCQLSEENILTHSNPQGNLPEPENL